MLPPVSGASSRSYGSMHARMITGTSCRWCASHSPLLNIRSIGAASSAGSTLSAISIAPRALSSNDSRYNRPSSFRALASRTTTKRHGCRLAPLGARVPAHKSFCTYSSGTGSGFSRRIARCVPITSKMFESCRTGITGSSGRRCAPRFGRCVILLPSTPSSYSMNSTRTPSGSRNEIAPLTPFTGLGPRGSPMNVSMPCARRCWYSAGTLRTRNAMMRGIRSSIGSSRLRS